MPNARPQRRCQAPTPRSGAPLGAGLDSGAAAAAQSAMPSIAPAAAAPTADDLSTGDAAFMAPQLQSRISTSLTDVTLWIAGRRKVRQNFAHDPGISTNPIRNYRKPRE